MSLPTKVYKIWLVATTHYDVSFETRTDFILHTHTDW